MMTKFAVGDPVEWTTSNTRKIGEIVAVVPGGQKPAQVGFPKAGGGGLGRDHESYVVMGRKTDSRGAYYGSAAVYWPPVSTIKAYS
ncbi:hypothetical protein ASE67_02450 [Sphingomonas sp. Leaf23]|nr:hypothetical protein ASE67_02450 [Sphingomonas sp. Leaf23]